MGTDAFSRSPVAMLLIEFTGKYWELMHCDQQKYEFCIRNRVLIRRNNALNFFDVKNNLDLKISAERAILCREHSIKFRTFPILIKHKKCDFAFSSFKENQIIFLPCNMNRQGECVFWYRCERDEKKQIEELDEKPTIVLMSFFESDDDYSNNDEFKYEDLEVETIPMDDVLQNIE